jgi:formylmethanofuran dehydrogenase subunit E
VVAAAAAGSNRCEGRKYRRRRGGDVDIPERLQRLAEFHGHLGPYVVIGLRMGDVARRELGGYKGLTAEVTCLPKPPMLCVIDGVQFASQCTMGKGTITAKEGPEPVAVFRKEGHTVTVRLRDGWRERIDREMSKEKEVEQSRFYFEVDERQLLGVLVPSGPRQPKPGSRDDREALAASQSGPLRRDKG